MHGRPLHTWLSLLVYDIILSFALYVLCLCYFKLFVKLIFSSFDILVLFFNSSSHIHISIFFFTLLSWFKFYGESKLWLPVPLSLLVSLNTWFVKPAFHTQGAVISNLNTFTDFPLTPFLTWFLIAWAIANTMPCQVKMYVKLSTFYIKLLLLKNIEKSQLDCGSTELYLIMLSKNYGSVEKDFPKCFLRYFKSWVFDDAVIAWYWSFPEAIGFYWF